MRAVTPLLLLSSLQALPPSKYPSLFQQSLETDIFPEIISILHEDYVRYVEQCTYTELICCCTLCNVILVGTAALAVVNCVLSNWGGWQRWSGSLWLWCFCLGRRKRVSWTWPYRVMPWQTWVTLWHMPWSLYSTLIKGISSLLFSLIFLSTCCWSTTSDWLHVASFPGYLLKNRLSLSPHFWGERLGARVYIDCMSLHRILLSFSEFLLVVSTGLHQLFKDLHSLISNDTDHLELQALAKVFSVKLWISFHLVAGN